MRKVWPFIVDNADNILAILIGVAASIYGFLPGSNATSILLAAIAGVLSLLAFGTIKDRKAREELRSLIKVLKKQTSADEIIRDRSAFIPMQKLLANAQEIGFVGLSLVNIFNQWGDFLSKKIGEQGTAVRVILLHPDSTDITSASRCIDRDVAAIRNEIKMTEENISLIAEKVNGSKGSIKRKWMAAYPNLTMVLVDPDRPNGRIIVEFIGYKSGLNERRHINLTRDNDPENYAFFLTQYKKLWDDSHYDLPANA